jgi:HSP20 family protein
MTKRKPDETAREATMGLGGFLGGLGTLLERLGELAEKGEQLQQSGELGGGDGDRKIQGVYGFSIKMGLGDVGVQVEPFGNVRKDAQTGKPVVDEVREPLVDTFEEDDHVLVVAEMPGISQEDVRLELHDDILVLSASHGPKNYRKEVLLPASFSAEGMSYTCRNGVLEVKLARG